MPTVLAHGVGARGDLPVDPSFLAWGGGLVLLVSFAAFAVLWTTPRLLAASKRGPQLALSKGLASGGRIAAAASKTLGIGLFALTVSAAFAGSAIAALNPVPWIVYVAVWTALPLASFVLGDIWRAVSPFRSLALLVERGPRRRGALVEVDIGCWPAALSLGAFSWVELAYHSPSSPRVLGWLIIAYTAWAVIPARWLGVEWTERADGLGWWFSTVAQMSPWRTNDDGDSKTVAVRLPTTGLATATTGTGASIAVLVVLGAATFDGFSRTDLWSDIGGDAFGWGSTALASIGLALIVAIVGIVYWGASRYFDASIGSGDSPIDQARGPIDRAFSAFGPSLIPIAFGYGIAHYFSLLVFEGQTLLIRLSDPFFTGADWLGTAGRIEDYTVVSPTAIAWIQVGSIIGGHIVAVMVAHDRALEIEPDAENALRGQYAMIAAMVAYTAAGLLLLVNA